MTLHSPDFIADILMHLSRQAVAGTTRHNLSQAQWGALRFFSHSNRLSRTPSAFASFHGTTRGTASQTIKSLVTAGYLERRRGSKDGRSVEFELTEEGRGLLVDDPAATLTRAISALPLEKQASLDQTILALSHNLDSQRQAPIFGSCGTCDFFKSDNTGAGHCHATDCPLTAEDTQSLCRQFSPI